MSRAHSIWTTKWEKNEEGGEQWMKKWQEDVGRLIVSRSSPFDLGRVRSQGLRPPRAHSCQGNCAVILTLHCLNLPSVLSIPPSFFISLFPLLKLKRSSDLLSTLMMSVPPRRRLSAESQQLAFKVPGWTRGWWEGLEDDGGGSSNYTQ